VLTCGHLFLLNYTKPLVLQPIYYFNGGYYAILTGSRAQPRTLEVRALLACS
jgi:hypothetical protein